MAGDDNYLALARNDLLDVANKALPAIADIYRSAAQSLEQVMSHVSTLMYQPDRFGGITSSAWSPWQEFGNTLSTYLRNTESNVNDTAAALRTAADLYDTTDHGSAHDFVNHR